MNSISIWARVNGMRVDEGARVRIANYLHGVNDGKKVNIKIQQAPRSLNQNRYYWGVVIDMIHKALNDQGNTYTPDQIHLLIKQILGYQSIELFFGKNLLITESTSEMDGVRFNEYLEKVKMWAATELGLDIPDPKEIIN